MLSKKEDPEKSAGAGSTPHMHFSFKRFTAPALAACGLCCSVWDWTYICDTKEHGMICCINRDLGGEKGE